MDEGHRQQWIATLSQRVGVMFGPTVGGLSQGSFRLFGVIEETTGTVNQALIPKNLNPNLAVFSFMWRLPKQAHLDGYRQTLNPEAQDLHPQTRDTLLSPIT